METNSILLVEDDFLNRRLSKKVLSESGYRVLEAKNAKEAFDILGREKIALAILDINLGEKRQDGVGLGHELQKNYSIPFMYLTAYDNAEVVRRAITTAPYSYLTKPFKNIELLTSVELAIRQHSNKKQQGASIIVKDGEYNIDLPIDEIDYIESDGNYLLFHTAHKAYKSRATIKLIREKLPEHTFIQTHRAFVVNKKRIEKFNTNSVIIKGIAIPVSKNFVDDISNVL